MEEIESIVKRMNELSNNISTEQNDQSTSDSPIISELQLQMVGNGRDEKASSNLCHLSLDFHVSAEAPVSTHQLSVPVEDMPPPTTTRSSTTPTRGRPLKQPANNQLPRGRRPGRPYKERGARSVNQGTRVSARVNSYLERQASDSQSEEDRHYHPVLDIELPWKNEIRQGGDYQAQVPDTMSPPGSVEDSPLERGSTLQWTGCDSLRFSDSMTSLQRYLRVSRSIATGATLTEAMRLELTSTAPDPLPDDELALRIFMDSKFNVNLVWKQLAEHIADKRRQLYPMKLWSEEDATAFEKGFAVYGKNFFRIRENKIPSRPVSDLVEFYYVWKKTQRCEDFLRRCGRDRRKYLLEPGLTDGMDCFVLDGINLTANYCLQSGFPGCELPFAASSDSLYSGEYCEDVCNLLRSINSNSTNQRVPPGVHPLAHLPKPDVVMPTGLSSKGHTSHAPSTVNITAEQCPLLCAQSVGGSWSLTCSSVTLRDLKTELQMITSSTSVAQGKVQQA